jgi:hypothetical protein
MRASMPSSPASANPGSELWSSRGGHTVWSTSPRRMTAPTKSVRTMAPLTSLADHAAAFALALPMMTTAARVGPLPHTTADPAPCGACTPSPAFWLDVADASTMR